MIRTSVLALIAVMFTVNGYSQGIQAFEIYNAKGKKVSYKKMLKKLSKEDITLFGEYHNNSIVHWLQLELTKDMGEDHELILGAEMFEQDNQVSLSDYVQGRIDDAALDSLARLWPNYYTDYKPLVDYAKANNLEFIATNIPRRFANRVYHYGFETLDSLSIPWMLL